MSERFVVTYHVASDAAGIAARARGIAVEQSVEMPVEGIDDPRVLADIVGQVVAVQRATGQPTRNVVFMGMGEPLANYGATWAAVERLHGDVGISARHLTVSTVGIVPGILKLADEHLPVNIGNPVEMTIKQIAETIITMTGSTSKIVYRPLPTDDPKQRRPDITRARTLLGWEPTVQLEEGLIKTIAYFRTKVG